LETTETTYKNNNPSSAAKPRGGHKPAGVLPAEKKLFLTVIDVVFIGPN